MRSPVPADNGLAPAGRADSPFQRAGLLARGLPFAVVAIAAEASLALPHTTDSPAAVTASAVLLLITLASFPLPWPRLPSWLWVLVPLAYTGSVLALMMAAGVTSGVGVVILIPLIWTALFHRRWESGIVVVAICVVQVVVSLVPVAVPDSVLARRVLLWAALGALVSVATHGLRDRVARSQAERDRLAARLREATVLADRDRIAADLRDKVIQRISAAELTLQGAASLTSDTHVRRRLAASVAELDHAVRTLRDVVFGLGQQPLERGLRREVVGLCESLSPAPEVVFSGPVDRLLDPWAAGRLLSGLREALAGLPARLTTTRISVTAGASGCEAAIELSPACAERDRATLLRAFRRAAAGVPGGPEEVGAEAIPGGTRFRWRIPLTAPAPTPALAVGEEGAKVPGY